MSGHKGLKPPTQKNLAQTHLQSPKLGNDKNPKQKKTIPEHPQKLERAAGT